MNNSTGNTTDLFMTKEQYEDYKFVIYLICLPIITIVGMVGNSLGIYVLYKYPTKHAFATYLKTLTGVDTVLLCTALLRSLFKLLLYLDLKHASRIDTYGTYYCGLILGSILQRLSSTFITVISLERFLAVCFPITIRTMLIEARPVRITVIVFCCHIVLQIPTFILVEVTEVILPGRTPLYYISRTHAAEKHPILTIVYLFSVAVLGVAVPLIFVLVTTCCIIIRIKLHHTKDLMKHRASKGSLERERMTLTLIVMATFFTIISVPLVTIYTWSAVDESEKFIFLRQLFLDSNIALICINSGSDFIIYCMTSYNFRKLFFKSVLCDCKEVPPEHGRQEDFHSIEAISGRQEESTDTVETPTSLRQTQENSECCVEKHI